MSFIEFIDAFTRITEKLSPIPLGEAPEDWDEDERIF